jgi:phosphohistidine phosphatase
MKTTDMKKLYFVRHAKAENEAVGHKDIDRELAFKGQVDAARMARIVALNNQHPQLLISSSAIRAMQTSVFFAEQFGFHKSDVIINETVYLASVRTLLGVVNSFSNNYDCIMLFGHNPGISHLVEYITRDVVGNIPTCGIVQVNFEVADWSLISSQTGTIKNTWFPEKSE